MILDLERLHDVLEGKYDGVRQQGHSTAMLVQLIQSAMLEPSEFHTYAIIVHNRVMVNYLVDMLVEVYKALGYEEELVIARRNGYVQFGNTKVEFISQSNIKRGLRGLSLTNYFVDKPVILSSAAYIELQSRLVHESEKIKL